MLFVLTPRVEVLAPLTGAPPPEPGTVELGVEGEEEPVEALEGAVATQATVAARTAPISTNVRIWVARGRRTK